MPNLNSAPTSLPPRQMGRPSLCTPGITRKICEEIMLCKPLHIICAQDGMPSKRTVVRWLSDPNTTAFRAEYEHARRVQAELYVDEIFTIADNLEGRDSDWIRTYNKKGEANGWKPDNEAIQRSRLRVDTRKWYAASLIPRIYGSHANVEHDVTGDLAELMKAASNHDQGLPKPIGPVVSEQ